MTGGETGTGIMTCTGGGIVPEMRGMLLMRGRF